MIVNCRELVQSHFCILKEFLRAARSYGAII